MVPRAGRFGQVPLGLDVVPDTLTWLAEPWLRLERALGHPELEHLARAAQRLAYRPPAVDLLARHFGTSW